MPSLRPEWASQSWMYRLPVRSEDQRSWCSEWGHFLLTWCTHEQRHLLSISDVITADSFRTSEATLSPQGVRKIFEQLIAEALAKWWDKKQTLLRVYWRTIPQWSDMVYLWGLHGGGAMFDPYTLQNAGEDFSSLPQDDLIATIEALVKSKRADWVDPRKHLIRLRI